MAKNKDKEFIEDVYKTLGKSNFNRLVNILLHCPEDIGLYNIECDELSCEECWIKSCKYNNFIGGISNKLKPDYSNIER